MQYISTRGQAPPVTAAQAILSGIAADGGLYVPQTLPGYMPAELAQLDYAELAERIFALYLDDFSAAEIADIVSGAYSAANFPRGAVRLAEIGDMTLLELWHGPTAAFKDLALQALPRLLSAALGKQQGDSELVILVATSGDTGKAALEGFAGVPHTRILVFYPEGGVSRVQELQMLSGGGANTNAVALGGNFDDCQNGVKALFGDEELRRALKQAGKSFSSANSINWGRLLPQIVYYYYAYGQMLRSGRISAGEAIDVAVPTGNFGNILAAWYARKMGLPIRKLICASNENNVLTDALERGLYDRERPFYRTSSPSMDILISSNFERFVFDVSGNDAAYTAAAFAQLRRQGSFVLDRALRHVYAEAMCGGYAAQAQAHAAIAEVFARYGYVLDPHTAVGWSVVGRLREPGRPLLLASTASPYKFPAAVLGALGEEIGSGDELSLLRRLAAKTATEPPASLAALEHLPRRPRIGCQIGQMRELVSELCL
ncbi:MAG: threonine synthase [Bacillota bacterium]|nr:threonine synthase [Bacillota bacterium]